VLAAAVEREMESNLKMTAEIDAEGLLFDSSLEDLII
tara:strand:+ start:770 stop:880 length:111 start_codon:yes stop_codon:yes gene_type:complete